VTQGRHLDRVLKDRWKTERKKDRKTERKACAVHTVKMEIKHLRIKYLINKWNLTPMTYIFYKHLLYLKNR
jgi:hypothetical protein